MMGGVACFAIASAVAADLARVGHGFVTPSLGNPSHCQQLRRFTPSGGGGFGGISNGGACAASCSGLGIGADLWPRLASSSENKCRRAASARRAVEAIDDYDDYDGPMLYAQDVLDEAWQFKKGRQRNSGGLALRFLTAFGGRPAMFSDNRDFMEATLDSVVRIYCTHNLPSWNMPWQRLKQEQSTSTGFVIEGKRIITNAHSVEYSTMVQVRRRGKDKKYQAITVAVGEECDLAILTVEDEEFWRDVSPLTFGELPELTDDVSVIGYPVGGECISITAGVVSRVEMTTYANAGRDLLSVQIDAAINPGNSGGPVVNNNGELVGVAFQSLDDYDVENIGYVVPVNVLEHFLEDVKRHDGKYLGFPKIGINFRYLESPALRQSLKMLPQHTGVLVVTTQPTSAARKLLREGDVIMKVDGISVANDGTIPFRSGERVAMSYYFSQLFPEDEAVLSVWRDDEEIELTIPLFLAQYLSPHHFSGRPPSYGVLGGLVFTVLSTPYLDSELEDKSHGLAHLLALALNGRRETEGEEVVVLTQVLAHKVNVGYEGMENVQVIKFNGERVISLAHLLQMVDDNKDPFLRFEFYPHNVVVLDAAEVTQATPEICKENSIPTPRSANYATKNASSPPPTSPTGTPTGEGSSSSSRSSTAAMEDQTRAVALDTDKVTAGAPEREMALAKGAAKKTQAAAMGAGEAAGKKRVGRTSGRGSVAGGAGGIGPGRAWRRLQGACRRSGAGRLPPGRGEG